MALSLEANQQLVLSALDSIALGGAEISAYDALGKAFYVTSSVGLQVVSAENPATLEAGAVIDFSTDAFGGFGNAITSVSVHDGLVAVAVANAVKSEPGKVFLLDSGGALIKAVSVGALPDMLTFTPDGKRILVANEGERDGENGEVDAKGGVSVIDLSNGAAQATVTTLDFSAFDGQETVLRQSGVRLFNDKPASLDLEPEYIAVAASGKQAMVTLQEANAVALLDLTTLKFTKIVPLGLKKYQGLLTDFSDKDGGYHPVSDKPVFGMYMPDAIAAFNAGGRTFYAIANEGDDRDDFMVDGEKARLSTLVLDPVRFPDAAALQASGVLGRLNTPNPASVGQAISGDTDGDGDIDQILSYGARSFSILNSKGKMVFDSGDHIERFIATQRAFIAGEAETGAFDDGRSDDKGPEPEGITTAMVDGRALVFVGLERGGGGVMVYDVTDVRNVQFVTYAREWADVSPEGLSYVPAAESATGQAMLAVTNELTSTLTVYGLTTMKSGSDGKDKLFATDGVDELTGAGGMDRFIFSAARIGDADAASRDLITDFASGEDRINLSRIDANSTIAGNQAFVRVDGFSGNAGQLLVAAEGDSLLMKGDMNGDGLADFVIELAGVSALSVSDIVL
jgi:DNA-binding beta-propeller fold protein YncE